MSGRERPVHHVRFSRGQRLTIYGMVGALWLTGGAWLVLHQFFTRRGPFGALPHPLEPTMLTSHGVLAISGMYLFGWITARHVLRWWPGRVRRWTGGGLAGLLAVLIVSGFALFFLTEDDWQRYAAWTHEALGLAVILFALPHWFMHKGRLSSATARANRLR
jgi:hypothetical protein